MMPKVSSILFTVTPCFSAVSIIALNITVELHVGTSILKWAPSGNLMPEVGRSYLSPVGSPFPRR